jgi:hypothetical protein
VTQRYGDYGQWATLTYQITGYRAYAAKAWHVIRPVITSEPSNANQVRQYFMQYAQFYDWLYPGLEPSERKAYTAGLHRWAEWCLAIDTPLYRGGFRVADSDQTVGQYFGLAFTDLVTGSHWLDQVSRDAARTPIGGLIATGVNRATVRNAIADYARLAAGGEWIESADYNIGTLQLLLMGVAGVRTATGKDYFPEVTRLIPEMALAQIYALTPDLKSAAQWGDTEHPHDLMLFKRISLLSCLAGLTRGDPHVGPRMNGVVKELVETYGARGYLSAEPWEVSQFYWYDPYAPAADWRTLPPGHAAAGRGVTYFRDGSGSGGALFVADMPNRVRVDHEITAFGDFQLYRKGEWAVTHPLGYGNTAVSGEAANSMLIAGLSSMADRRHLATEFGPAGAYAYAVGTTGGAYYDQPYYDPPPAFLREWTRSLFYLPSADGKSSTVIAFDRVNVTDPRTLPKYDRYRAADRARIESAPALAQWQIHSPVMPTLTADGLYWDTAGGQRVQVSTLSGQDQKVVYDQKELWAQNTDFLDREKGYQTRLWSAGAGPWQTFLNVVQVSDPGTELGNLRVASRGGEVQGALVRRGGLSDALVLFGANPDTRVLGTGYTVGWTADSSSTEVYLADLDPTKWWKVSVNGGPAVALEVSTAGIGHLTVPGVGLQSIQLVIA